VLNEVSVSFTLDIHTAATLIIIPSIMMVKNQNALRCDRIFVLYVRCVTLGSTV